jgi:hypothetical protein
MEPRARGSDLLAVAPGRAACLAASAAAVALGASGVGFGRAGRAVEHAQRAVVNALTEPSLGDVTRSLERYHALSGTYAGADVGGGLELRLRWATDTAYCLESAGNGGVQHLLGPNGRAAPGPCLV